ncbi:MAG: J domain-containing protein [Pirellulales bacterium]|nr:J domain-containing protein [Pirellulales bacterium]
MSQSSAPQRPPFMEILGLLPPYSADDVAAAFRDKVMKAHPDRGGNAADFQKLNEAFQQANEYVAFRTSRRAWLAAQVEHYAAQEALAERLRQLGCALEMETFDWLRKSVGEDFAVVTERIDTIRCWNQPQADRVLAELTQNQPMLDHVRTLDFTRSTLSDGQLLRLQGLPLLHTLILVGTPITRAGLENLTRFPQLQRLQIGQSGVGVFGRWQLKWKYPRLKITS